MLERPISKAGWTRAAFGDVVRKVNDKVDPWESGLERYVAGEHMDTADLRIRRWGLIGDDYLGPAFHMRFKPGHVLYGSRRTYLRKVALADFEGITANTTFVLETKDAGALMPELLPFLMQTEAFHSYSIKHSKGSVNPYINFSDLEAFEFQLPPIQEQARLVEALAAYRSSEEALGVAADQLAATRASLVSQVISQNGTSAQRAKVGDLLTNGPTNGRSPAPSDSATGFKTVSITSIRDGAFDPEGCIKFVDMTAEEARPFTVRSGDIFAVRGNGNRDICGRVGISRRTYPDLVYPDLLIRMRFDPARLLPDFVVAQWNHPAVHKRLISRAKSSNGIWKVNGQDIRAHTLVVPPIEAQRDAVQFLGALDAQATAIQGRFEKLREMKRELFKAISGGAE
ncbi:restriction endonuclease subunit S [Mesorhizobium sp.]|uniref:restriction endonuclease subunit S n=1 Tax=Mesorhizobium sp. TaxID=1871066 RepID=UPI00257CE9A6|nr:restriction endonuclease subunit S [Mesorhizobium sp.]